MNKKVNKQTNKNSDNDNNSQSDTYIKEIKNAPSALLSYISTRDFLRTREKC